MRIFRPSRAPSLWPSIARRREGRKNPLHSVKLPAGAGLQPPFIASYALPERVIEQRIDPDHVPGWDFEDMHASRALGDAWYDERRAAVLLVPSIVTRVDLNVVINPNHPGFTSITTTPPELGRWDARLFRRAIAPGSMELLGKKPL